MRNSITKKVPYALVIGDKEMQNDEVTYRRYGDEKQITVKTQEFIDLLKKEIEDKKFLVDPKAAIK